MKKLLLLLLACPALFGQIKGKVTDEKGQPLPFVSVLIENTYNGTTTNDGGQYEFAVKKPGHYTLVFQYLGFRTRKVAVNYTGQPYPLDVSLAEESVSLGEVVIDPKANPANEIIRKAIAARKENSEKTAKYTADFYSRGIFRIKNAPKRVLGTKLDMFDDMLDSTRTGILYLSETVSKIVGQKPDRLKETIIASKVSGNDNGFSFNNAASVDFDFYQNYVAFTVNTVSPIASNAFNYYKYKLEGTFYTGDRQQIYKIKVTSKRPVEPAYDGYIYIVDDSYAIYAIDLTINGSSMATPALNTLTLRQEFAYNAANNIWTKNTQVIDFTAGILGLNFNGRFTYVYSNYEFPENFAKRTFTNEVLTFADGANKKGDSYWNSSRPVPLTAEESTDYDKKAKLQEKKKSRPYLDSIDRKHNKFKPFGILTGYNYQNSDKKWDVNLDGVLTNFGFNTVQGYFSTIGLTYTKRDTEKHTQFSAGGRVNYGLAEDRVRATGFVSKKFNNTDKLTLSLSGGSSIEQFNPAKPISRVVNSIATTIFRDNYMKLYDRNFIKADYSQEVVNGVMLMADLEYNRRHQLFNNTSQSITRNNSKGYTSNNPLAPEDFTTPFFEGHHLMKAHLTGRFSFGQQYWKRPDGKFDIPDDKYPILFLTYEKGFAGSESKYDFDQVSARLAYDLNLGNKGVLGINVKAGKFFRADSISFIDYKHFNGNQTHIGQRDRYLNTFNLLPYYTASTNDAYVETHLEHSDNGYFINKIPVLRLLRANLILGAANLTEPNRKPYSEFSIGLDNLGFGKFRFFRFDYVRAYQGGYRGDGVVFGLKFLNILD
jgi:hypothetical protein